MAAWRQLLSYIYYPQGEDKGDKMLNLYAHMSVEQGWNHFISFIKETEPFWLQSRDNVDASDSVGPKLKARCWLTFSALHSCPGY